MKTDMMQSLSGGADTQSGRMDGMKKRCTNAKNTGFAMEQKGVEQTASFKRVLQKVVEGNKTAEKSTRSAPQGYVAGISSSVRKNGDAEGDAKSIESGLLAMVNDMSGNEPSLLSEVENAAGTGMEEVVGVDEERADAALELIMEALAELSNVLGIELPKEIGQFSLREITGDTTSQLSEVVYTIKKITESLEVSGAEGIAPDIAGVNSDAVDISQLTDKVRTAGFRIELACKVLGIAEAVGQEVALKMDQGNGQGIVQATNPQDIIMSPHHAERLFGTMYGGEQPLQQLSTLVDKIRKMFSDASEGDLQIAVVSGGAAPAELSETSPFESRVYRALLKIDAMQNVETENKRAAENDSKILSGGDSPLLVAESFGGDTTADDPGGMASIEGVKTVAQLTTESSKTVPDPLMRMTDESVAKQVTEKLHSVIRAGLSEMRIQLRPESLGEVKMRIRMEGDVVLAQIEVQNQQVKEIMERSFGTLKDALAQHNLTAGAFDVQVANNNGRQGSFAQQNAWFDQEQEQEHHARHDESHEEKRASGDETYTLNTETGRRYGGNSVEYFG